MNDLYSDYAILDAQIKELTNQQDALKARIMEAMVVNGETKVQHTFGSFSLSKLKKWEYPEYITKMEKETKLEIDALKDSLEAEKAKAQNTREAVCTITNGFRFTPITI